jgi:hypothetical protein
MKYDSTYRLSDYMHVIQYYSIFIQVTQLSHDNVYEYDMMSHARKQPRLHDF